MTTLQKFREFLQWNDLTPDAAMDRLQDAGMVSDCAVYLEDCAPSDLSRALIDVTWIDAPVEGRAG